MKDELLNLIASGNLLHRKKLERTFERNPEMVSDLEKFLDMYGIFMKAEGIGVGDLSQAYLSLLEQIMESRLKFMRLGHYPTSLQKDAIDKVYGNNKMMTSYMLGLGLSLFLWEHHYKIFNFYRDEIAKYQFRSFLEVGSGHGLFILEFLNRVKTCDKFDVVDISNTSLTITKSIVNAINPGMAGKINFIECDISLYKPVKKYDFIVMGEVLEHVENPLELLQHLYGLLDSGGKVFISTCANCPAIDHLYQFHNTGEIQALIEKSGFSICRDLIVPSIDKPIDKIEKLKIDVSYAAILSKEQLI